MHSTVSITVWICCGSWATRRFTKTQNIFNYLFILLIAERNEGWVTYEWYSLPIKKQCSVLLWSQITYRSLRSGRKCLRGRVQIIFFVYVCYRERAVVRLCLYYAGLISLVISPTTFTPYHRWFVPPPPNYRPNYTQRIYALHKLTPCRAIMLLGGMKFQRALQ
jgi:hypothetical protein